MRENENSRVLKKGAKQQEKQSAHSPLILLLPFLLHASDFQLLAT